MTWDEFCGGMKKTVDKAAKKINQTADLATLQVKLTMAEHKLKDAYAALGEKAYVHFNSDNSSADAVAQACTAVETALSECEKIKKQIEKANGQTTAQENKNEEV